MGVDGKCSGSPGRVPDVELGEDHQRASGERADGQGLLCAARHRGKDVLLLAQEAAYGSGGSDGTAAGAAGRKQFSFPADDPYPLWLCGAEASGGC